MLQIEPTGWFSWEFTIVRSGRTLASLDISWWRDRGELVVDGATYAVVREGLVSSDFRLSTADGATVASATKPSILRRRFEVVHRGRTWTLEPRSAWGRAMTLLTNGRPVGDITPGGIWTRRATATLPEELSLPVQVFVVWLAVLLWKRESDAAVAAS
jgi:hypothetical protein